MSKKNSKSEKFNNEIQFLKGCALFSRDFYTEASKAYEITENLIFAPYFIYNLFGCLFMGAAEKTEDEIACVLELPCLPKCESAKLFHEYLTLVEKNPGLRIASRIYLAKDIKALLKFRKVAKEYFHIDEKKSDFARIEKTVEQMNSYVFCKTEEKIPVIVTEDLIIESDLLYLICAVYFKGAWKVHFNKQLTCKTPFWIGENQNRLVEMMHYEGLVKCSPRCGKLNASVIELEYDGPGKLSMMIILPLERMGLKDLEKKLRRSNLLCISRSLTMNEISLKMPKFSIEFFIDLETPLKKLGMEEPFTGGDFSCLGEGCEELPIKAVHKTLIEVSECSRKSDDNGCYSRPVRSPCFEFKADHPFFFVIKSKLSILLIGRFCGQEAERTSESSSRRNSKGDGA